MPINNGNLRTQQVIIPRDEESGYQNRAAGFSQGYDYDSLNRLRSVQEDNPAGANNWRQWYDYDRYGNRTLSQDPSKTYGSIITPAWSRQIAYPT